MEINDISYSIRGAIFKVYNNLGPGLLESVYHQALVHELTKMGLNVQSDIDVPIVYDNITLSTPLRIDILVENCIIIELKSVLEMKTVFFKQLLTYLKLANKPLGFLVNFNTDNLTRSIHRILNPSFQSVG